MVLGMESRASLTLGKCAIATYSSSFAGEHVLEQEENQLNRSRKVERRCILIIIIFNKRKNRTAKNTDKQASLWQETL